MALRDFRKNTMYWSVSVFSIALAVASVLVITHYVTVEKSYDKFNDNSENIFRVVSEYKDGDQLHKKAMAPGALGFYLKENSTIIDNFCAFSGKYGPEKIAVDTTGFFIPHIFIQPVVFPRFLPSNLLTVLRMDLRLHRPLSSAKPMPRTGLVMRERLSAK